LVEKYRQRKYVDDLDYLKNELKGMSGLLEALDVTLDNGITHASMN
jgi:hypothetical protein